MIWFLDILLNCILYFYIYINKNCIIIVIIIYTLLLLYTIQLPYILLYAFVYYTLTFLPRIMPDNNDMICTRSVMTKCKSNNNCSRKHITPHEFWQILVKKNLINHTVLNSIKSVPYCKNHVSGRCNGNKCDPSRHFTTKQVYVFLSSNGVIPVNFQLH